MVAMWTEWLGAGVDGSSAEEIERSMEHEIEGMLELDELELSTAPAEPPLGMELAIVEALDTPPTPERRDAQRARQRS